MKNIIVLFLVLFMFSSCSDFLDQNPNPSGNKPISSVKDLDLLLNNPSAVYGPFYSGSLGMLVSDDYGHNMDVFDSYRTWGAYIQNQRISLFDKDQMSSKSNTWISGFKNMYAYNLIINTIDDVDGDAIQKKKLEAEARSLRAYFHFQVLVEFAEWDESKPGIGYVDDISEQAVYKRKTVEYTLDRINKDIEIAEQLFDEVGVNSFNVDKKWRISLPALMAFKARVALYRGDYITALESAEGALSGYNTVDDLTSAPLTTVPQAGWPASTPKSEILSIPNMEKSIGKIDGLYIPSMVWNYDVLFPSKGLLDLYDDSDLRKKIYYDNNITLLMPFLFKPNTAKFNDKYYMSAYYKFGPGFVGGQLFTGPSVAEMMLVKAECLARKGDNGGAKNLIVSLRDKRFADKSKLAINNGISITGSIENVLDERRRELSFTMRWYDLKRYNALKADPRFPDGITIKKVMHADADGDNPIVEYSLAPNAGAYALPIPESEIFALDWEQNSFDGVTVTNK